MGALLRQLRVVLWSLFGVRRGADSARDLEDARPGTLIGIAVVIAALIVLGLASLARYIGSGRSAPHVPAIAAPTETGASRANGARSAASAPETQRRIPDTIAERMRACGVCHGDATRSTTDGYSPRIAGKPAGYLYNQLTGFRDGRRTYAPMVYLVQHMSDDYLREIAAYFAGLELPHPAPEATPAAASVLARGRDLVQHGDAARHVPACADCHGASLSGAAPAIPGLLGLPRDYVNAQLGAWRTGKMRSIEPDCMGEVARRMAPDDVVAVATWIASQPVSEGARPGVVTDPLPLPCGSVKAATP